MASAAAKEDYYCILEVDEFADDASIASSYRRLARLSHPDKNLERPEQATADFQRVSLSHRNSSEGAYGIY